MSCVSVVVFSILICGSWSTEQLKFPPSFMFGAASAAYQVEGAWNVSDKSPGLWDKLIHHRPELVADGSNGDVACDSYHLWRRDIEMCEELGLNMYRFSISWSRLLPTGFPNHISEDGKNYYNKLIDGLLEKGIQPIVTIFHFDFPQSLQDLGGWANPLIADWFTDYAAVVFSLYADRVKYWLTINEPMMLCDGGYEQYGAPYLDHPDVGRYLCNKNTLIAHAKAYRLYDELYRDKYHGKLSLPTLFFWFKPFTPEDQEVTDLTVDHWEGRYAHAIFSKEGGWPRKLEKLLNDIARKEGYAHPRLPPFTPEEIELVKGTYDYYALNHYTTRLVRRVKPGEQPGKWLFDGSPELNTIMDKDSSWGTTAVDWFAIYPEGLREQLHWLNSTYDVKEIIITENGVPSFDPGLVDTHRLEYYRDYLRQVLLAINDGINVTGYTAWTLMDNFEWLSGYVASVSHSFGCVHKFPSWFKFGAASAAYQVEGAWNVSGGWANPQIADWFADYARIVYSLYGDRVKTWLTINEPLMECDWYYGWGILAPESDYYVGPYICNKNLLLAHAKAYHVYDQEFRDKYNGKVSIANHFLWLQPYSDSPEDKALPEMARQFVTGRYTHAIFSKEDGWPSELEETIARVSKEQGFKESRLPAFTQEEKVLIRVLRAMYIILADSPAIVYNDIYKTGRYTHAIFSKEDGWPSELEETIARVSKEQGFKESRLPAFTQEEKVLIRGTYDYLSLNHYTTKYVRKREPLDEIMRSVFTYIGDLDVVLVDDPSWAFGYNQVMPINPKGIREKMAWLKKEYGDIEILITENGYSTGGSNLTDDGRISFIHDYLEQVLLSINDGVNVTGYTYWTIMDNFEWRDGYQSKFGLYEVDFSVPMRTRTARNSAVFYSNVISQRSLNVSC